MTQLMFSLISGEMYTIFKDELKTADRYQIPLKRKPPDSCKKCHGRFFIGRTTDKFIPTYIICPKCVKYVDTNTTIHPQKTEA